jgi:ABC-type multidrug transport system ATPase subunit
MGSSGAGKSSLLDLLAGRVKTGIRSGEVMVNGQSEGYKLKHIASYVMQDDALHAALTVCIHIQDMGLKYILVGLACRNGLLQLARETT